ncbi:hypothetical protein B0T24DRAFT_150823 [Lasiosphaeria ovina]|uniref:Uncharacterized protein n=1 Tax=Lasiosphaeria ovina TaxID=92902 RepID=A0AAE0KN51_9PEZI|nr:hypothetical protein B0T24DRAFT_150823 [Lasiosphaeria ovina]
MSSPAQGGPSVPKEKEKKGLGKVLSRVKTVLKKADPSRRLSTFGKSGRSTAAPATGGVVSSEPAPPAPAVAEEKPDPEGSTRVPRTQLFAERAKKLGELYGLELKPSDWYSSEGHALRVEKPIRMRVHRQCHECKTSFGLGKECPNCKHVRCKQCPRVPPKRTEAEREASRVKRAAILKERAENPRIIPDWNLTVKEIVLRKPAKKNGQDLVHKKPRQRVRRTCCECEKLFVGGHKTCDKCTHTRCTDCPREPGKKDRYPYGYPGDVPGTKSAYYECHECRHIFYSLPSDDTDCPQCTHKKCTSCVRQTPRKVDPEPDPEVWQRLQVRLAELRIT